MQLTKLTGELLVASELARRGWLTAVLSGNTPGFDLVATDLDGRSVLVQVKANSGAGWQLNVGHFINVTLEVRRQVLGALKPMLSNLVCVMLCLGKTRDADQFFVLPMVELQRLVVDGHRRYLAKHGGARPKSPRCIRPCRSKTSNRIGIRGRSSRGWRRRKARPSRLPRGST